MALQSTVSPECRALLWRQLSVLVCGGLLTERVPRQLCHVGRSVLAPRLDGGCYPETIRSSASMQGQQAATTAWEGTFSLGLAKGDSILLLLLWCRIYTETAGKLWFIPTQGPLEGRQLQLRLPSGLAHAEASSQLPAHSPPRRPSPVARSLRGPGIRPPSLLGSRSGFQTLVFPSASVVFFFTYLYYFFYGFIISYMT